MEMLYRVPKAKFLGSVCHRKRILFKGFETTPFIANSLKLEKRLKLFQFNIIFKHFVQKCF